MIFDRAKLTEPRAYRSPCQKTQPDDWKHFDASKFKSNLVIEIGCGKGHWIINQALNHPSQNFVAIERTFNKSHVLLKQTQNAPLHNLFVIRAEAIQFIHSMIPDECVNEIHILFPNPTPKLRQANQRFIVGSGFHVLNKKLKPDGQLHLASNIRDYIEEAQDFLMFVWKYSKVAIQMNEHIEKPRTAFEKKYIARGEIIYDLIARK